MPLDVNVEFFGLCHFIEDSTPNKKGMCIVFPEAVDHESKIKVTQGTLTKKPTGEQVAEIEIFSERVEITLAGSPAFDFQNVVQNGAGKDVLAALVFKDLIGGHDKAADQIVHKVPPGNVRGQIVLREGSLAPLMNGTVEWEVKKNVVNGSAQDKTFIVAARALWKLSSASASKAILKITPFGGTTVEYELTSASGVAANLEIFNECTRTGAPVVDEDFRFHYQLLDSGDMAKIRKKLKDNGKHPDKDIPLPKRLTKLMALLKKLLDKFDPSIWERLLQLGFDPDNELSIAANLAKIEDFLLELLGSRENAENQEEIRKLQSEIRVIVTKAMSSSGTGGGCNCLGCFNGKLPIEA